MQKKSLAGRYASFIRNWRNRDSGASAADTFEVPLFTDAHLTGEIVGSIGPYSVLNTIAGGAAITGVPAAVLRLPLFGELETPNFNVPDTSTYHGGRIADEIAALLSLDLGIRLKAGPATRHFRVGGDPLGSPIAYEHLVDVAPSIPSARSVSIPSLRGTVLLRSDRLGRALSVRPEASNVLVKSARQYQEAVWVADTDPALAWLLLVSAAETAANHWRKHNASAVRRLRDSRPELERILLRAGGKRLVSSVAKEIADFMGASKKFCDFLLEFAPKRPTPRPPEWAAIDWTPAGLRNLLKKVYHHRSRALHGGTPFPSPLARIPRVSDAGWRSEVTLGSSTAIGQTVWVKKDLPMLLWTFEYIVSGALRRWWTSISKSR